MCKKKGRKFVGFDPSHEFILVYCGVVGFGGMSFDGWRVLWAFVGF